MLSNEKLLDGLEKKQKQLKIDINASMTSIIRWQGKPVRKEWVEVLKPLLELQSYIDKHIPVLKKEVIKEPKKILKTLEAKVDKDVVKEHEKEELMKKEYRALTGENFSKGLTTEEMEILLKETREFKELEKKDLELSKDE